MVTRPLLEIVATEEFELEKLIAPPLVDVGVATVNAESPNVLADITSGEIVGIALLTINVADVEAALYRTVAAWLATMTAEPTPTIVTRPELVTVATEVFCEVYVTAPSESVVGGTISNDASPYALAGTVKELNAGVLVVTLNVADVVADA